MIVAYVADWHAAVVKVVLFVASGGGGSQARPTMLAEWRFRHAAGGIRGLVSQLCRRGRRFGAAGPRECPGWRVTLVIVVESQFECPPGYICVD